MGVLVFDEGHSIIKGKTATGEDSFPHAIKILSNAEYEQILAHSNNKPGDDYLRVNGVAYVIGESAERHGIVSRRSGPSRYTPDYYGVFAMAMLVRLYRRSGVVSVFGSHPPGDVAYRQSLMDSVVGDWEVEVGASKYNYHIDYANAFDEPMGGLMNMVLNEDGQSYRRGDLNEGRTLIVDIGGRTTDFLAVNPGGEIDYSLNVSIPIGLLDVMSEFENSFRHNNREAVKAMASLPQDRVREAIRTGVFKGGGREYPCQREVNEATSILLNKFSSDYQHRAGGPLPWDNIGLTGGGPTTLYHHLLPILNHERVLMAEEDGKMHLANVRGGLKLWRLYDALGVL